MKQQPNLGTGEVEHRMSPDLGPVPAGKTRGNTCHDRDPRVPVPAMTGQWPVAGQALCCTRSTGQYRRDPAHKRKINRYMFLLYIFI